MSYLFLYIYGYNRHNNLIVIDILFLEFWQWTRNLVLNTLKAAHNLKYTNFVYFRETKMFKKQAKC